jgi:hypothetical protein
MDFEDNLRLVLSPAEQLPRHINLGEYNYQLVDGKHKRKQENALRFRKLKAHELDQLLLRLHAPQQQVIVLNIGGNYIGDSGCSALSQALPHLSALQQLDLESNFILFVLCSLFLIVTLGMDCR